MPVSYPRPGYNGGTVATTEHEALLQSSMPDGVRGDPATTATPIYADGTGIRTVKLIANQKAVVRGSVYESQGGVILPSLPANTSGQPRIDLIVLRLDRSDYSINPLALTGTPGANPSPPAPVRQTGTTGFYDLPLAQAHVASGATFLAPDDVTSLAWFVGDDGQIRCTPGTRPPHDRGRQIWEHPTGTAFISNGSSWLRLAEDISGSFALAGTIGGNNGWVRKRNGWVFFSLTFWRTTTAFASDKTYTIGRLAEGFWPAFTFTTAALSPGGQDDLTMTIQNDGWVKATFTNSVGADTSCVLAATTFPAKS